MSLKPISTFGRFEVSTFNTDMALARLDLSIDPKISLPSRVCDLLADASGRIDRFIESHLDDPAAGFVPSDYEAVYRALKSMRGSDAAGPSFLAGLSFCEWGSGMGVIACLASMIGYDSVGIEIDARLVEASRSLASDHQLNVELVHGSYVPNSHTPPQDYEDDHVMTLQDGRAAYDELGLDPDDFDCIFAYPWPGEDDVVTTIFDRYAATGAVLITFHGQDGMMVRRKVN